jgi:photosystem II stability/assembly factor-like uncharacterized protein
VAFSDPVDGSFLIIRTADGGAHWVAVPPEHIPPPLAGEAGFAASGTAIHVEGTDNAWFGTGGGSVARVFYSADRGRTWSVAETPIAGGPTSGIFGITFWDTLNGVAVGGDHTKRFERSQNVIRSRDGGRTWTVVGGAEPPGCRYGVAHVLGAAGPLLVATGPSGWGYSRDEGASWTAIDTLSYNTLGGVAGSGTLWAAGVEGRIAKLIAPAR